MDDGPKPMKDLKPTQKNPNSADQFWLTHQAEYENRSKTSMDRMERIHQHNLAYPKLRDELDKRRSVVEIKCRACMKLKRLAELKKRNIKPKCKPRTSKKKYQRERKSRVKKTSRIQKSRVKPPCRRKCSNQRQYYRRVQVKDKYTGTDYDMGPTNESLFDVTKTQENNRNSKESQSKDNSATNSVHTLKSPDTSDASITSYNTFASKDQEPMVSMD